MESRFRFLLLALPVLALGLSGCAATKNLFGMGRDSAPLPAEEPGQVIDPEVDRRDIKEPAIDTEDFEVGAFAGIMSIEDFGSDLAYGVRLAYHITEGFFVEGTVGQSEAGLTSFEILSGGAPLLSDDDRFSVNFGFGYRFILTDSVSLRLDFRDHLFDIDLLGEEKTVHNLEGTLGLSIFF